MDGPHRVLVKYRVLFLGNSVPEESSRGLEALQQPLLKCYPTNSPTEIEGIDSWLTIYTSGIQLQFIGEKGTTNPIIWFPIQHLYVVAGTKCVNYVDSRTGNRVQTRFVELRDPDAKYSRHPPLFSFIVRLTTGRRVLECFSFLAHDEAPAVAMVEAVWYSFQNKSGWTKGPPPKEIVQREMVAVSDDFGDTDDRKNLRNISVKKSSQLRGDSRQHNGVTHSTDLSSPDDNSQNISDSDLPSSFSPSAEAGGSMFPTHLLKRFHLSFRGRPEGWIGQSTDGGPFTIPLNSAFNSLHIYGSKGQPQTFQGFPPGSVQQSRSSRDALDSRSRHDDHRRHPPLSMIDFHPPSQPSTVREVGLSDQRAPLPMGAFPSGPPSVIERVIREPVFIPVPVKERPPPPQVIREIKEVPVYIPTPPLHTWSQPGRSAHQSERSSHHSSRRKIPENFYHMQNMSEFMRHPEAVANVTPYYPMPVQSNPNGHHHKSRKSKDSHAGHSRHRPAYFVSHPDWIPSSYFINANQGEQHHRKPERGHARRYRDSSRSSSDERREHGREYIQGRSDYLQPVNQRWRGGGVEITELHPPEEQAPEAPTPKEKKLGGSVLTQPDYPVDENEEADFKWKKAGKSKPKGGTASGGYTIYKVEQQQSHHRNDQVDHASNDDHTSAAKQYFFKENASKSNLPRNWMQPEKEFMNERAFSESLAARGAPAEEEPVNAYALNSPSFETTIFDRAMPGTSSQRPDDIPPPPPLPPADLLKASANAAMY